MKAKLSVLSVLAFFLACRLSAQSIYGEIRGTVFDPSGAVIADAQVRATNKATGEARSVKSDAAGNFALLNLEAGPYDVLVEHGDAAGPERRADAAHDRARIVDEAENPAAPGGDYCGNACRQAAYRQRSRRYHSSRQAPS